MQNGFLKVLKNKDFVKIWVAQIFSQTANHLLNFLLVLKIFELTGSNKMVSFLVLTFTIPSIIFGIYAGVCADRFSQKRTMYLANILRALIVLGYAYLGGSLWYVFAAAFMVSSAMQFFMPAEAARIPAVVKEENYMAANSLYIFTTYGALLLGYSLAGAVQLLAFREQFLLLSLLFLISAIVITFLPYDEGKVKKVSFSSVYMGVKEDIIESWDVVRVRSDIYMPIIYLVLAWVSVSIGYVILPALARDILHINAVEISHLVVIPAGIGAVSGAFLVESFRKRFSNKKIIATGIFFMGLTGIIIASIPNLREILFNAFPEFVSAYSLALKIPTINILLLIIGFSAIMVIVPAQTLLQENTKTHLRGRVFGFLSVLINISSFVPILIIGILADLIHMQTVMLLISGFVVILGVGNLFYVYRK